MKCRSFKSIKISKESKRIKRIVVQYIFYLSFYRWVSDDVRAPVWTADEGRDDCKRRDIMELLKFCDANC